MASDKTANLGLTLTTDDQTLFKEWREAINGKGEETASFSNAQIIDNWAGEVGAKLPSIDANTKAISEEATRATAKESELSDAISKAGKIDDVQVDGKSVVANKVANIDLSSFSKGVIFRDW